MSIATVSSFLTAALAVVGIALGFLLLSVGIASFQFFAENRQVRVARHEPLVGYYRQLALS